MSKPKLFIGSSVEGIQIAYSIQENLKYIAETTVWDQGVFNLSESSLESLISMLDSSDFGVFVFSPDDHIKIRGKKDLAVRDNVLFELGLFLGKLGRKRSFIIVPDNKAFHLPTDLIGLTPGTYETDRADNNFNAATGVACQKIREAIVKQGAFTVTQEGPEVSANDSKIEPKKEDDWFDLIYLKKEYDRAITILKKKVRYAKEIDDKIHFRSFICSAEFQKDSNKGLKYYENLISEYPTNNLSYLAYANNLISTNSLKKALEVIEIGIERCDRKVYLTNLKAKCFWTLNRKNESLEILKNIIAFKPDSSSYIALADYFTEMNDDNSAYNCLIEAYFALPMNETILYKLAKVAYEVNQKEICVLLYTDLLTRHQDNSAYWCLLGNAYLDLQLYSMALSAYEKGLGLSQESWIYSNIGNLYNNKELYDKAEFYLKKSIEINSESEYSHNRLSEVYSAKEKENKKLAEVIVTAKLRLNSETSS